MDPAHTTRPVQLTRTHRMLIGVVVTGAVVIAGIGFAGSYTAVRELAIKKGFGEFSSFFPIGIDAGICVLLALDLLLTWIRMPFPLLRQTAWVLTIATVAFNAAAASDPLGMGMHAVIPVLFVVTVEAARHAIGRIADITADKHMEGVRLTRWLLAPAPTFLLWRRMKLWELRSYDQVIKLEQERLVYQARLRAKYGRGWRRKAPVESLMPLRLARYGVPLSETGPAGLAAAGIAQPVAAHAHLPRPRTPQHIPELRGAHDALTEGTSDTGAQGPEEEPPLTTRTPPLNATVAVDREISWPPIAAHTQPRTTEDAEPEPIPADEPPAEAAPEPEEADTGLALEPPASTSKRFETIYTAFKARTDELGGVYPSLEDLSKVLHAQYNISGRRGKPLSSDSLRRYATQLRDRYEIDVRAEASVDA